MAPQGLRERKAARTREQIAEAARAAFESRGYDATTLDEIAEAAEVHKRTVLRYFPTKAHLVLHAQYAAFEDFESRMATRGQGSTLAEWRAHVERYTERIVQRGERLNSEIIAKSDPGLQVARLAVEASYQAAIAQGLCEDYGRDAQSDLLTKVVAAALVAGHFGVARMQLARRAYGELAAAEFEVMRIVTDTLVPLLGAPAAR
jgi:AcrR family transcriptional regulator